MRPAGGLAGDEDHRRYQCADTGHNWRRRTAKQDGCSLVNGANVVVNRQAVEAELDLLKAGGDFANGVIAYEGSWLGAETFVSFDRNTVKLMTAQGKSARLLS